MGWTVGAGGVPHISVNGTGGDLTSSTSPVFTWPAGTVFTHPGPQGGATAFTVVEWKSPVTGDAAVAATLRDADVAGGGTGFDYWILKNDVVLESASVPEGLTYSTNLADIAVEPGDSLYLVVGPGALYYWDSTHLVDFGVTVETPDPVVSTPASSPWTLALMALIGLAAVPVIRRVRATA
jgi:MYXO-CTERM domain-containing protein